MQFDQLKRRDFITLVGRGFSFERLTLARQQSARRVIAAYLRWRRNGINQTVMSGEIYRAGRSSANDVCRSTIANIAPRQMAQSFWPQPAPAHFGQMQGDSRKKLEMLEVTGFERATYPVRSPIESVKRAALGFGQFPHLDCRHLC
jgi:hypothetical protein